MKIAVQLFGHLRTYEKCYHALHKHLLSKYDCDVFMHTWSTIDHGTETWHKNKMRCASESTQNLLCKLEKNYALKGIKIEDQMIENLGTINAVGKDISVFGMKAMFHSMKGANCLREEYQRKNGVKYDFVVILRPDIFLKKDFVIKKFIKRLDDIEVNNTVFTAGYPMAGVLSDFKYLGATDVLFFAKPNVLTTVYQNEDIFFNYFKANTIVNYGPEYYFSKTIEKTGFRSVLINFLVGDSFKILRPASAQSTRRSLLSIRVRKNFFKIQILSIISVPIVRMQFNIGDIFSMFISIGASVEDEK